ncbi:penicillin-binding protein 2 [Coprothermobacteraceae bacterium]|nr:penicillin-binding protein 2 [Coprothermobacteraceae bacterium]
MRSRLLGITALLVVVVFGGFAWRLYDLQVVRGQYYSERAENNYKRYVITEPVRGRILDRNGAVLAYDETVYNVAVVPALSKDIAATKATLLALGAKPEDVEYAFSNSKFYPFQPIVVMQDVPERTRMRVLDIQNEDPSLSLVLGSKRVYPYGELAAFVTGYVGRASKEDLQRDKYLRPSSIVGKMAAEKVFDEYLRGKPGVTEVWVDATGKIVKEIKVSNPEQGHDVVLTVDIALQQVAWNVVGSEIGGVFAANPANGEIYAMVSKPSFDPNAFVKGVDKATWERYQKNSSLMNRMTMSQIPTGSTFKVITGLAGLYYRTITPNFTINDPGYLQIGSIKVWNYRHRSWGKVDFVKGLAVSNNVYFGTVGLRTGIDKIYEVARTMGLTDYPWIEYDAVAKGRVPNPDLKEKLTGEPWYPGDTVNTSIGQGLVGLSPVLMAQAYQQIINDGILYRFRLLKEVRDGNSVVYVARPEYREQSVVYRPYFAVVREAMKAGVDWGILKSLGSNLYQAAGKSGTAETEKKDKYHKWLIAYANYGSPELMVVSLRQYTTDTEPVKITKTVMEAYFSGKSSP